MIRTAHGPGFTVTGHAIVSADGMIADADGSMPPPLRNDADFALFQAALDAASVVVVGRLGHLRHPNPGRRRLVFTATVPDFAADAGDPLAALYNPAGLDIADALARMEIAMGTVAVTGGQRVFDWFAPLYDEFMLAEVHAYALPGGIACFGDGHPRAVLAREGLKPRHVAQIDAGVTLTRWTRDDPAGAA